MGFHYTWVVNINADEIDDDVILTIQKEVFRQIDDTVTKVEMKTAVKKGINKFRCRMTTANVGTANRIVKTISDIVSLT
jgi:hypothetical protein